MEKPNQSSFCRRHPRRKILKIRTRTQRNRLRVPRKRWGMEYGLTACHWFTRSFLSRTISIGSAPSFSVALKGVFLMNKRWQRKRRLIASASEPITASTLSEEINRRPQNRSVNKCRDFRGIFFTNVMEKQKNIALEWKKTILLQQIQHNNSSLSSWKIVPTALISTFKTAWFFIGRRWINSQSSAVHLLLQPYQILGDLSSLTWLWDDNLVVSLIFVFDT